MEDAHRKPKLLAKKLFLIREYLKLSQQEMAAALDLNHAARISDYETGTRQPTLKTLLAYSNRGGVSINLIADDEVKLTTFKAQLGKYEGMRRTKGGTSHA